MRPHRKGSVKSPSRGNRGEGEEKPRKHAFLEKRERERDWERDWEREKKYLDYILKSHWVRGSRIPGLESSA